MYQVYQTQSQSELITESDLIKAHTGYLRALSNKGEWSLALKHFDKYFGSKRNDRNTINFYTEIFIILQPSFLVSTDTSLQTLSYLYHESKWPE